MRNEVQHSYLHDYIQEFRDDLLLMPFCALYELKIYTEKFSDFFPIEIRNECEVGPPDFADFLASACVPLPLIPLSDVSSIRPIRPSLGRS